MNKLTITINTANAAFEDSNFETARILERIAFMLKEGYNLPSSINDVNGNKVAKIEVE